MCYFPFYGSNDALIFLFPWIVQKSSFPGQLFFDQKFIGQSAYTSKHFGQCTFDTPRKRFSSKIIANDWLIFRHTKVDFVLHGNSKNEPKKNIGIKVWDILI